MELAVAVCHQISLPLLYVIIFNMGKDISEKNLIPDGTALLNRILAGLNKLLNLALFGGLGLGLFLINPFV